jgi:hypothetical protein
VTSGNKIGGGAADAWIDRNGGHSLTSRATGHDQALERTSRPETASGKEVGVQQGCSFPGPERAGFCTREHYHRTLCIGEGAFCDSGWLTQARFWLEWVGSLFHGDRKSLYALNSRRIRISSHINIRTHAQRDAVDLPRRGREPTRPAPAPRTPA